MATALPLKRAAAGWCGEFLRARRAHFPLEHQPSRLARVRGDAPLGRLEL